MIEELEEDKRRVSYSSKGKIKLIIKRKPKPIVPLLKKEVSRSSSINRDSEDSFDRGENPKRNLMVMGIAKNAQTSSFYSITLDFVAIDEKYFLTIRNTNEKRYLCKK